MTAKTSGLIMMLLLSCVSLQAETNSSAQQAAAAWADRDQAGQTEKAIGLWQEALKENPSQGALWIDLTKALGRAVRHAPDAAAAKKWADQARAAGEKAVAQNPDRPAAWAYDAEALGQWADTHKGPGSLSKVKQAVRALEKALALDPHDAYAHMLLAEFYRQAPAVISVGNKKKALAQAQAAVQDDPSHAINHLVYARALNDNGRKGEALSQLRAALSLSVPPDAIPETKSDQETARDLLRQWGGSERSPDADSASACSENNQNGNSCGR